MLRLSSKEWKTETPRGLMMNVLSSHVSEITLRIKVERGIFKQESTLRSRDRDLRRKSSWLRLHKMKTKIKVSYSSSAWDYTSSPWMNMTDSLNSTGRKGCANDLGCDPFPLLLLNTPWYHFLTSSPICPFWVWNGSHGPAMRSPGPHPYPRATTHGRSASHMADGTWWTSHYSAM